MARWQLKMQFFANPSCVRRKKTFAKKISCVRARKFEISLAILPSYHLKAFFDMLRQKNDNDNEDENESLNENVKRRRKLVVYNGLKSSE